MILRARFRHVSKGQRGKLLNPWSEAAIRPAAEKLPGPGLLLRSRVVRCTWALFFWPTDSPRKAGCLQAAGWVGDATYGIDDALYLRHRLCAFWTLPSPASQNQIKSMSR